MASHPATLTCEHCGETFLRREHRHRHMRKHSGVKPFQCEVCSKSFARSDTLVRHNRIHRIEDQTRSTPRRCVQACLSCARLKQRCGRGLPCARCQETGTECTYGPGKATSVTNISPRTSETPTARTGAATTSSISSDLHPSDTNGPATRLHVASSQLSEVADQSALHYNDSNFTSDSTSNNQSNDSFSPTTAGHPISLPTVFTPSSLPSDSNLYTSDQWDPSLSLYGDAVVSEFASGWNDMTAYFPFCLVPAEFEDALGAPNDMTSHKQQCGIETRSYSTNYHMQGQAAPAPSVECLHQNVPDRPSNSDPTNPVVQSSRSHVQPLYRRLPQTQDSQIQTAEAETFGHVHSVPARAYGDLQDFYATQCQDNTSSFVPMPLIQAFVDLYFEYFDPQFPFLHISHLEAEDLPWILLLATAAIGSYYSELDNIQEYTSILCDLLGRAVDSEANLQIKRPSKPLIQSTFLRRIHLSFCGLYKEIIRCQYQRHMLVDMCYDMVLRRDDERTARQRAFTLREEWAQWLTTEEEIRLVCCVYMLECIHFLFTDIPTNFDLFDISRQMPCPSGIWYSKDLNDWKSKQKKSEAVQLKPGASQEAPPPRTDYNPFLTKMSLLSLYINEKNIQRQRRASRLAMNLFGSHLRAVSPRIPKAPIGQAFIDNEDARIDNPLLDESIDHIVFSTRESASCHESLPHILAILRCVSLQILFTGTGWQANTTQMTRSKTKFREFLERDGELSRKCLWHAARISKSVQTMRRLVCYDMFSVGVAICYIALYMELRQVEPQPSQASADTNFGRLGTAPRRIVRLDQLSSREDVQNWVRSGGDADIHLTNVGILRGLDSLPCLFRATEKALLRQVAWSAYFRAWARNMVQHIRGEKPTLRTDDYNEAAEKTF